MASPVNESKWLKCHLIIADGLDAEIIKAGIMIYRHDQKKSRNEDHDDLGDINRRL